MEEKEIILAKAKSWLSEDYDQDTRNAVQNLIDSNLSELEESFYKDLEFGTGGLRGIMGVGTNRMNIYTIAMATQGLSNYLKSVYPSTRIRMAIAFDSRINSELFAKRTAEIFSANGIEVYMFRELRPTPELSFTIRKLNCQGGIVITASHNPKEFNGYKVYWNDGGQLVPPHDKNIINEVRKISSMKDVKKVIIRDHIKTLNDEIDKVYIDEVINQCFKPSIIPSSELKIVYTPIHGTGITMIPQVLEKAGFSNVQIIQEQAEPNGSFPTVKSPNPEEESAMAMAMDFAQTNEADIVLGTDPDTDRVGIGIRNDKGFVELLNGNQAAVLIIHYAIENLKKNKKLKPNHFIAKTIVTTQLIDDICASNKIKCYDTLTGFKYIAEQIRLREGKEIFIAGGEESYGYLIGDYTRDKDAVVSSLILCEIAAWAKSKGQNLISILSDIYREYGFYKESLVALTKKGRRGSEEIQSMMDEYRDSPKKEIIGKKLLRTKDYQESIEKSMVSGNISHLDLPKSNVIQLFYEDGLSITARPSGTEPKIKFYLGLKEKFNEEDDYYKVNERLDMLLASIQKELGIA